MTDRKKSAPIEHDFTTDIDARPMETKTIDTTPDKTDLEHLPHPTQPLNT